MSCAGSCYLRGFKLSFEQSALAGVLLLASTTVGWVVQPSELPLNGVGLTSWTNLAWLVLAVLTEVALVRATEKVPAAATPCCWALPRLPRRERATQCSPIARRRLAGRGQR